MKKSSFVDVLLPLPVPGFYTYCIPDELADSVNKGKRVVVQFGKRKIYTALVYKIHNNPPSKYEAKDILSVLDINPIVNEMQFSFWNWMAAYYLCTPGEVMNAALPSALKLASESKILLNPDFDRDFSILNEKEYLIAEALDIQKILTVTEVSKIVEQTSVLHLINNLLEKKVIIIEEEIRDKYKAKTENFIRLSTQYQDEKAMKKVFDQLEKRAFRQLELLMSFISLSRFFSEKPEEITQNKLLKSVEGTSAALNTLIKKGILERYQKKVSRFDNHAAKALVASVVLNEYQQKAYDKINQLFKEKEVVLLHGITSSGKTEIYIKLIDEVIKNGKQVLYLLPEIALTAQIINRLRNYFGDKVGIYHSKYNEQERVEVWNRVLTSSESSDGQPKYQVILGARSALFLPFKQLGLIIVDEEHDTSYKQYDPAPRYNARDGAIYLAGLHNANVLLGSATPAVESYFNAHTNKYGHVEIMHRYGGLQLPETIIIDLRIEHRRKKMKSHFSSVLLEHMKSALEQKEQVILFQNRRGFSLRLECDTCGWMPQCKHCDVTLIYHKHTNQLKCHYCGYATYVPSKCPECNSNALMMKGFGTEKIEEEIPVFFPDAKVSRMDLDTTRSKQAYHHIINDFEERRIDILVGTQMLTKGLDFDNVSIVGILNADNMINYPDFRSYERSFQLISQVSGRAGRKKKRGKVFIQTFNPKHFVIKNVIDFNYHPFISTVLSERNRFHYPPYTRLIKLTLKHKDRKKLDDAAFEMKQLLKPIFGKQIIGPEFPVVSRIRLFYIKDFLIKLERDGSISEMKQKLMNGIDLFYAKQINKSVRVIVDVDPY
ncbi:primosomal protein N' [candidate division KSB1 bacterium]